MAGNSKIKGITVEIGGNATGLDKVLQDSNKSINSVASELKEVDKALKLDPKNVEILAQKQELLGKAVELAAEKLNKLKGAQEEVEKQFQAGTIGEDSYRAFQREVVLAQGAVNKAEDELDKFGKTADKTDENVEELTEEIDESADVAEDAGSKFDNLGGAMEVIGGAIAAATLAITAAAGAAVAAMVDMSKEAAQYADDMATMSTQTGLSTDTLQAYSYAAELVDVSLDTLTGSMAKQIKSMSSAAQGSKTAVEAYEKLGVSVTDANGNMRDGETVYWEVIDALGQIENETERDALAMQLLGKSAQALNPLITLGADALGELMDEAKAAGAVLSEDALNSLLEVSDGMERLSSSTQAAKNNIGVIAADALAEYYNGAASIMQNFTGLVNTALNGEDVSDELITQFTGSITSTVESIAEKIPQIMDTVTVIFDGVMTVIGESMPTILETIAEYLPQILTKISDMLPDLVGTIIDIITAIIGALIEALPEILQCGVEIILAIVDGITEALPDLIPIAVEAIITIVKGLIDALPDILEAALQIILALADGLLAALPQLIEELPEIIIGIVGFLIDSIPQLIDAGITLFVALIENTPAIIAGIIKAIPKIIKGITDAIKESVPKLAESGLNLIKGLWNGINDAAQWLKDKISGFFGGVVDSIKGFFGIKSPSTLFRDEIGKHLAEGVGEGFVGKMKGISKDMQKAIPTNFDLALNAADRATFDNGERNFELVTPISIGGQRITKVVSRVQYNTKINRARVVGVTAK